jgi:hypothetical protein
MPRSFALALAATTLLAAEGVGFAQTPTAKAKEVVEEHIFKDEVLLVNNLSPSDARIGVRGGVIRTLLVRPRTTFVPDLLKSIEKL